MTLIVLDPRTGEHVIVSVPIRAPVRQPEPAVIIEHPRFSRRRQE